MFVKNKTANINHFAFSFVSIIFINSQMCKPKNNSDNNSLQNL